MADDVYRFCKIFLRSADPSEIKGMLASLLGGEFQRRSMYLTDVTVDVLKNPDAGAEDDFVRWPTFVEVEAGDEAVNESVAGIISKIVEAMWEAGIPAVAACSFEDELPWRGGIGRLGP
jgi:hypothetical protein